MARTAWLLLLATLLAATAGCFGGDDDTDGTGTTSPTATGTNTNTTAPPVETEASISTFEANQTSGTAPLDVTFELDAESDDDNGTWRLAFGDGSEDVGGDVSELPTSAEHTYEVGGNYSAVFEVVHQDGSVNETIALTVEVPEQGEAPPDFYEFGPSAGCIGDTDTCVSREAGPDEPPVDGFWVPLDERYVGAFMTTTIESARGDSDGWFIDADGATITDVHNGADAAEGSVPPGAAWLFVFSYADPSTAMTVSFAF